MIFSAIAKSALLLCALALACPFAAQAQQVAQTPFPGILGSPGLLGTWLAAPAESSSPVALSQALANVPEIGRIGMSPSNITLRSSQKEPIALHLTGYLMAPKAGTTEIQIVLRTTPTTSRVATTGGAGLTSSLSAPTILDPSGVAEALCKLKVRLVSVSFLKIAGQEVLGGGQGDGTSLSLCGAQNVVVAGSFSLPQPGMYPVDLSLGAALDCSAVRGGCHLPAQRAAVLIASLLSYSISLKEPDDAAPAPARPGRFWKEVWNAGDPVPGVAALGSSGFATHGSK